MNDLSTTFNWRKEVTARLLLCKDRKFWGKKIGEQMKGDEWKDLQ